MWAEKSFYFNGEWVKGTVMVPAVSEDLFEDRNLKEAQEAVRPRFEMGACNLTHVEVDLKEAGIKAIRDELYEIEYRLRSLTDDQNRDVSRLFAEVEARKNDEVEG